MSYMYKYGYFVARQKSATESVSSDDSDFLFTCLPLEAGCKRVRNFTCSEASIPILQYKCLRKYSPG